MSDLFKVGAGKKVITPHLGTLLYGYAFKRPAARVADDLYATALAAEQGSKKAILISVDIVSIPAELTEQIQGLISQKTGVLAEHISISATHTHSGPAIKSAKGWGSADEAYIYEILIPNMIAAAQQAVETLTPALMGVGTAESKVGVNRRELDEDGIMILGQNPYGVFDPEMTVVSFRSLTGQPLANFIHYGCHGTAAGRGLEITRDWPGNMVDRLERETGAITLFFNGAEGDVGPRLSNGQTTGDYRDWNCTDEPTGDIQYAYELGNLAALDAIRAYNAIHEYRDVNFQMVTGTLKLPYDAQLSYEQAKARLQELSAKETLEGVENREIAKMSAILQMYENKQCFDTHMELSQTIFAFNSTVLVPFQFEMFSEIALRMRMYSPFQHTLCTSNTNGANFYLPTQDQMVRGGYEINIFRLGSVYKLVDNVDDIIIQENLKLLNTMQVHKRKPKVRFVEYPVGTTPKKQG